jgi:2-polyprenyl-6-methoxyphenol hydroxylase-like FAD-dependent oxidoreductase
MGKNTTRSTSGARDAQDTRRAKVAPLLAAGMSVRAISAKTGIPVGAVHRAKRYLEKTVAQGKQQAAAVSLKLPTSYLVKQDIGGAPHDIRRLTVSVFERAVESAIGRGLLGRADRDNPWTVVSALPGECCCFNRTLVRVEERADGVTAIFADGSSASGSLLIAADGIDSTVRRQLLPEVVSRYAGYVCWRGVVEEADTPPSVQLRLFDRVAFCFPAGELFLGIPNPGINHNTLPGRRRYIFCWYRPVKYQSTLQDLCTDATGKRHGVAIPPPLIRHEFIRELKTTAETVLAPEMATIVARTEQPLLQAIFDLESPQLVFGRVVLLGDAAFVARPHVVAGTTKAALDAQCLADSLAAAGNNVETGLAHYDTECRQFGRSLVARARYLGAHLEAHQTQNDEERRQTHLTRDPVSFMQDYGAEELIDKRTDGGNPIAEPVETVLAELGQ